MIKVAISGADTPEAGELIRILVNHPDVEIVALIAQRHDGKPVQSLHHGLLGEINIPFSSSLRPDQADLLIIADKKVKYDDYKRLLKSFPDLKVITLHNFVSDEERPINFPEDISEEDVVQMEEPVYALPEINRKALVRGAKAAEIPSPLASLVLVPLYPLANHMLLSGDITLNISAPDDMLTEDNRAEGLKEIKAALQIAQRSFNGDIKINPLPAKSKRGMELEIDLRSPLDLDHLLSTYDIYDDHNFAFTVINPVHLDDVKGTEKVITSLSLSKDGMLNIHAVADGRLRGSAGEAVHVMNLMFGLHEKTGLYLKPYAF
ncbi:MAG: hypothetical protein K2M45_00055 [Muribaculaceae bacterium]|nr:hypothetical protein [Muribaculaceae bacterium]MDE6835611.1 hypothetical protein [Muribaculaceae bacterium]